MPSSLMKIDEEPPWRAYVCIAFLSEYTDGALRGKVGEPGAKTVITEMRMFGRRCHIGYAQCQTSSGMTKE